MFMSKIQAADPWPGSRPIRWNRCRLRIAECSEQRQEKFKIGIVQLVEHNALDAANKGFVDGLKERGYEEGKNITIDRQNAQADQSNLCRISASAL